MYMCAGETEFFKRNLLPNAFDFRCKSMKETLHIHIQTEKKYKKPLFFAILYIKTCNLSRCNVCTRLGGHTSFRNK